MSRSVPLCRCLLRKQWHRLSPPLPASPAFQPFVSRFTSASSSSASSTQSSSSSPPSSSATSIQSRSIDPSLYSSSHLSHTTFRSPTSQPPQPARQAPYVAYQSEYEDTAAPTEEDDTETTTTSPPPNPTFSNSIPRPPAATPTASSPADDTTADEDDSPSKSPATDAPLVNAINQLSIEGLRDESATGPAMIQNKPLNAKYKPTSRTAGPRQITPTHGTLTTLQLHRLLALYALSPTATPTQQQHTVELLAARFGLDASRVGQLVRGVAVGRVYGESAGASRSGGSVDAVDGGEEKYAVWREEEVPPNRPVVVQGSHLVAHLQAWERSHGKQS